MAEYIEREAALEVCKKAYQGRFRMRDYRGDAVALDIGGEIKSIPAADVAPVVHGRWIITKEFNSIVDMAVSKYTCSACGEYRLSAVTLSQATKYCPNCGARMDEGD